VTSTLPQTTSQPAPAGAAQTGRRTGLILLVVLTTQLMLVLDSAIVNIALPDMQRSIHLTPANLSWVVNAYTLAFGGLLLLGARAGDLLGRRRTFLAGLAVFTVSSILGGLAHDSLLLLASRAAQGAGAALAAPSALAILMASASPGRQQTRAIGLYTVVSAGGAALGLIAGGVLTSWASWRWVFFVNVPIGLVILALGLKVLPRTPITRGSVDTGGALLVTVGMTSLVYGFIRAASHGWAAAGTIAAFALGGVLLAAFVRLELHVAQPVVPLRLFGDRDRVTSYVARLLLVAGSMGTFFFMSQYMQIVLGWSPWQSGLAFLPIPFSVFLASQVVSRAIADRISNRAIAAVGLLMTSVALLSMSRFDASTTYLHMVPVLVLFGLGNGISFVPLTASGLAGVALADTGVASGLVNVTQQLGGALGLAVLVSVFASAGRDVATTVGAPGRAVDAFVTGADRGFTVAGSLLLVATALVLLVMRRPSPPQEQPDLDDELRTLTAAEAG
jgi:EmrB/QacA subfamily drug resistance transporter